MKEISLTRGYVALVDDEDYERVVGAGSWCASVKPKTVYALHGVRRPDGRWTTARLHNFITGLPFVDHINGNGLDNRRENLRPANKGLNGANTPPPVTNTSGIKGVTWHKGARKWMAQIVCGGRRHYLGLFTDPVPAMFAYDAKARELFGDYAQPNLPYIEPPAWVRDEEY